MKKKPERIFLIITPKTCDSMSRKLYSTCASAKMLCIMSCMRQENEHLEWPPKQNDKNGLAKELWKPYFKSGYRARRFEIIESVSQK